MSVMKWKQIQVASVMLALLMLVSIIGIAGCGIAVVEREAGDATGVESEARCLAGLDRLDIGARYVGRLVLRSAAEGISRREMEAIQREVLTKAIAKGFRAEGQSFVGSGPTFPEDLNDPEVLRDLKETAKIDAVCVEELLEQFRERVMVAYGVAVGCDGRVMVVISETSREAAITAADHQWALDNYESLLTRLAEGPEPAKVDPMGGGTWQIVRFLVHRYRTRRPFGRVYQILTIRRMTDAPATDREFFSVEQTAETKPGRLTWAGSDYRTYHLTASQRWWENHLIEYDPFVVEWEPRGELVHGAHKVEAEGAKLITVMLGAIKPILEWVFLQHPRTVISCETTYRHTPRWRKRVLRPDAHAAKNRSLIKPGSTLSLYPPQGYEWIVTPIVLAVFRDPIFGWTWAGASCAQIVTISYRFTDTF